MGERIKINAKKSLSAKENSAPHKQKTGFRSQSSHVDRILFLQRTIGNQAVQRLIKSGTLQAKLKIGQPGDKYEQEADRIADAVMRMPEPRVQRQPIEEEEEETIQPKEASTKSPPTRPDIETNIQSSRRGRTPLPKSTRAFFEPRFGHDFSKVKLHTNTRAAELARTEITPLIQRQENLGEEKEEELIQTKITRDVSPEVTHATSSGIQSLQGGGRPLSRLERSFFEPRFGADFSNVRVHNDTLAASAAQAVNARAFTHGHNLVFGAGEYSSESLAGRKLLAHELTHVLQQSGESTHFSMGKNSENTIANSEELSIVSPEFLQQSPRRFTKTSDFQSKQTFERVPRIQRQITGMGISADPIHDYIIKDFRRAQGLPLGGVDPVTGEQVGPTDAQIKYGALWMNKTPKTNVSLGITGPSTIDHYCAIYVPSNAKKCGIYPALNITLTASGVTKGTPVAWSVTKGKGNVKIVGSATKPALTISGVKKSKTQNDVTIQVKAGKNVATHHLSVLEPTSMTAVTKNSKTTSTHVGAALHYKVFDQFNDPMGAGICIDETIIECDSPFKPGVLKFDFKDAPTDKNGMAIDNIFVNNPLGIPSGFCVKLDQDITVGGCGPLLRNIIVIQSTGITVTKGNCKANSSTCP
jgi:hypothetical protein